MYTFNPKTGKFEHKKSDSILDELINRHDRINTMYDQYRFLFDEAEDAPEDDWLDAMRAAMGGHAQQAGSSYHSKGRSYDTHPQAHGDWLIGFEYNGPRDPECGVEQLHDIELSSLAVSPTCGAYDVSGLDFHQRITVSRSVIMESGVMGHARWAHQMEHFMRRAAELNADVVSTEEHLRKPWCLDTVATIWLKPRNG